MLACWLAPATAAFAHAAHVALHHPREATAERDSLLQVIEHGHAHESGAADHDHTMIAPAPAPLTRGVAAPGSQPPAIVPLAASLAAAERGRLDLAAARCGPAPPARSIRVLRI